MSTVKTDIQDIGETRKKISVSISVEEIAEIEANTVKGFQRDAKIPGFRPGKASESVVRMRYAKELKSELSRQVLSKAYNKGVAESGLEIYSLIETDKGQIISGSEATVVFVVDVIQEFEIPEYRGIKITVEPIQVTAEEIDKSLNQMLGQRAEFNVVEKAAEKGDYVRCSYEGKVDDEPIAEFVPEAPIWGTQKATWEEAGAENAPGVKAIVDGIIGMKAGDLKQLTMEFPIDFKPEALAGKTAVYSLEVEEVREKVLPEMDESFFEAIQVKDEAELRERISKTIEDQKKQRNSELSRQQIIEHLLKSVDIPIPESGIESERNMILHDFIQQKMQQGASEKDFETHKEQLHESANKTAHDRIKSRLILSKIAEKENIKVENEDFGRMIMVEAQLSGQKPEKIVEELKKDQDKLRRLHRDITLGKTITLIASTSETEVIASETEN